MDFRPISLGNISLLSKIIYEEQTGFVQGRLINTHRVIAQELTWDLSRKMTGANVILKFDMAKAYNRLEWQFFIRAMEVFGFSLASRGLIYRNLANSGYQFRINGILTGNVWSSRGVRQGDPLSHLLFILAQHILSHNIQSEIAHSRISAYKVGRYEVSLSHLLYADNVFIFTNGAARSLKNLIALLHEHEKFSGQLINKGKSGFYMHDKFQHRAPIIARATGLQRKEFPLIYLGVPIYYGRMKAIYFEPLIEKFRSALEGWKARLLSFGGRITLIKLVLATFPIYILASAVMPKLTIHQMEKLMAHFSLGVQGDTRTHWVSWKSVCTPISEGGFGIRRVIDIMAGLHAKLLWLAMLNNSLWARFIRTKYFEDDYALCKQTASPL